MPCDGREISKTAYAELYRIIGGTWGETTSTFFLPDLRGQFVRGWDDGDGVDPDSGADYVRPFGSEQIDTFQGHSHEISINGKVSESNLYYKTRSVEYGTNSISSNRTLSFKEILTPEEIKSEKETRERQMRSIIRPILKFFTGLSSKKISHQHELPEIIVKDASNSTFQKVRVSTETRPKNIALMYCIKFK